LSLQDGRVTLTAKDATVRQILAEWARIGQTTIVNVERIPGGPVTLELSNVPEQEALDVLLRSLSGYMAAPRAVAAANLSRFDRIVVMPTSAPPRAPVSVGAPPPTFAQPQPQFAQPQFQPPALPTDDDVEDERPAPPVPVSVPGSNLRGPVFNTFPAQPQVVTPQGGAPAVYPTQQPQTQQPGTPNAPVGGVAFPGMVVQPPPQPGQPGQQPGAPGQPPRRPGGPEEPEGQ
jgi:hypothetical protein